MTASHAGKDKRGIQKMSKTVSGTSAVAKRLSDLHTQHGTWKKVAAQLPGCDRALLCRIAAGKQHAPRSVLKALGMIRPRQPRRQWKKIALMLWAAFLAKQTPV